MTVPPSQLPADDLWAIRSEAHDEAAPRQTACDCVIW